MSEYILSCCSTADLSKEHFESRNIEYICFHYKLNGVDYPDDLGQSIPFEEFYKRMDSGEDTQTSQINVTEYLEYFTKFLSEGKDVLHLTLSSGISGSYNSAINAAKIAKERFPERKIYVIDSLAASSGYGLLMDKLADLRDGGMDIEELKNWAEENKLNLHHWFFSSDLKFFIKGGRVSKTSGTIGTILGICPLLNVDKEGHLIARAKIRSKKLRVLRKPDIQILHELLFVFFRWCVTAGHKQRIFGILNFFHIIHHIYAAVIVMYSETNKIHISFRRCAVCINITDDLIF